MPRRPNFMFFGKENCIFFKIGTFWMVQIFWESQWVCTYHRRLEPYISGMKLLVQLGTERISFLSFCSMDDPLWCQSMSINNTFWGHQYNNMLLLLLKKILINLQFCFVLVVSSETCVLLMLASNELTLFV